MGNVSVKGNTDLRQTETQVSVKGNTDLRQTETQVLV